MEKIKKLDEKENNNLKEISKEIKEIEEEISFLNNAEYKDYTIKEKIKNKIQILTQKL